MEEETRRAYWVIFVLGWCSLNQTKPGLSKRGYRENGEEVRGRDIAIERVGRGERCRWEEVERKREGERKTASI